MSKYFEAKNSSLTFCSSAFHLEAADTQKNTQRSWNTATKDFQRFLTITTQKNLNYPKNGVSSI